MPIYYHSDDGLVHITSSVPILNVRASGIYSFSGSGGTPPKKPHAPVKRPVKKPKK